MTASRVPSRMSSVFLFTGQIPHLRRWLAAPGLTNTHLGACGSVHLWAPGWERRRQVRMEPHSCPICWQVGWPGKPSLLSKTVGTVVPAQIRTGLNPENHKIVLYVLGNIFNRRKLVFPRRNNKKPDEININYSVVLFSSFLDITVPSHTHHLCARGDARHDCIFSKQNKVTHTSVLWKLLCFSNARKCSLQTRDP